MPTIVPIRQQDPVILAHRQASGVSLFQAFMKIMLASEFNRYRVDEIRSGKTGLRLRTGFAGGEWRIETIRPDGTRYTVKYDARHPLPTMKQLTDVTVGGRTAGMQFDVNNETIIRGNEVLMGVEISG